MKSNLTLLISLFFLTANVVGQSIVTDRPDQTESAVSVTPKSLQIESGILVGYTENGDFSERTILAPTTLFRIGLFKGVELRMLSQFENLEINSAENADHYGISDLEIGAKVNLLNKEGVNTQIGILSHLVLPSGSKGLSGEDYGSISKLSIAHSLSENVALGYNLGFNYFGNDFDDTWAITYTLSLGIGITDKLSVYIEPFGETEDLEFDNYTINVDAGFTYLINDRLQFDYSFGTGINETMNYMSVGCSWLIGGKGE